MLRKKRGTNQHRNKYEPWHVNLIKGSILITLIVAIFWQDNTQIVRPVPTYTYAHELPSPTPTETPGELEEVISYITKVFEPEGKQVVREALDVAFCESGWRKDAYNFNNNGTGDHSLFQINDVHEKRNNGEWKSDWKKNVDTAYEIYKEQGWNPWVCAGKLGY